MSILFKKYLSKSLFLLLLFFFSVSGCKEKQSSDDLKDFPKKINIFGITILASEKVKDEKIIHAAKIMAQYLDNNEDGKVDNQAVVDKLTSVNATLIMFETELEAETSNYKIPDHGHIQGLWDDETIPSFNKNTNNFRFDASLEEVLHLITHEGYAKVYPKIFGESKGSEVAKAMDNARGGYFITVPSKYPTGAWYSYDDKTCDYRCMITEYTYWSLTSILGAQAYPGRFEEIKHEWKLNTLEKVKNGDPSIYSILTNFDYKLPTKLPDNNYNGFIISLNSKK